MATKVVTSAVAVIPPEHLWTQIQQWRKLYDRAYDRWMPHISMLYPFVPEGKFSVEAPRIEKALARIAPFQLRFAKLGYFEHGKNSTLFLMPETVPANALQELETELVRLFPQCDDLVTRGDTGFHPHLTIGQFPTRLVQQRQRDLTSALKPIEFTVDHISVISRSGITPFTVKHSIPLNKPEPSPAIAQPQQLKNAALSPSRLPSPASARHVKSVAPAVAVVPALPAPTAVQPAPVHEVCIEEAPGMFNLFDEDILEETPAARAPPARKVVKEVRRAPGPRPEGPLAQVLDRVETWLYQQPQDKLPKAYRAFGAAIKNLCIVREVVITVEEVLEQMEKEGYLSFANGNVTYNQKADRPIIPSPKRGWGWSTPDPRDETLDRCRNWIMHPKNNPKSKAALTKSLEQLCITKKEIDAQDIMSCLQKLELVELGDNDLLVYKF